MSELPKGWVETTLGEAAHYVSDKISISEVNLENYISTENLLVDKMGVVQAATIPKISKVNAFDVGDTLFSNIRTYFKKVWYSDKTGGSSNDVLVFRPTNNKQLDKKYLYYLISNDGFIDYTVVTAKGTKMPRGDKGAIKQYPLRLPPLDEQKSIADILIGFDDKIELLRAQNKTLETLAQTLFKEWFVKFNFPNATGEMINSELGQIPKGWKVEQLKNLSKKISKGTTPKKKDLEGLKCEIPFLKVKDITDKGEIKVNNLEKIPIAIHQQALARSKLYANDILFSIAGTIGRVAILPKSLDNSNCNQAIAFVRLNAKDEFLEYVHQWIKYPDTQFEINSNIVQGVQANVSLTTLGNLSLLIPSNSTMIDWNNLIKPIYQALQNYSNQIQTLEKTRDALLPKLMSGNIRVN